MSVELKYSSSSNKMRGTKFYLNVFEHTELAKAGFIPLDCLEQAFKFNLTKHRISYFSWETDADGNTTAVIVTESYDLNTLIKECAEVKEFANKYFQEYLI